MYLKVSRITYSMYLKVSSIMYSRYLNVLYVPECIQDNVLHVHECIQENVPGNIFTDYMCRWQSCQVNNYGLCMFTIGFSETKCLQGTYPG